MKKALCLAFVLLCGVQARADTLAVSYTLDTAEIDRIVAAYQQSANTAVNGNATRNQVLQYVKDKIVGDLKTAVSQYEKDKAVKAVPDPVLINPK